jgi:hypothetical protein
VTTYFLHFIKDLEKPEALIQRECHNYNLNKITGNCGAQRTGVIANACKFNVHNSFKRDLCPVPDLPIFSTG